MGLSIDLRNYANRSFVRRNGLHINPCELPNAQQMPQEQSWGKALNCLSIKNESWTSKFIIN